MNIKRNSGNWWICCGKIPVTDRENGSRVGKILSLPDAPINHTDAPILID